jgi:RTX calcium-binding nonapeptide repeat (4 copies)
VASVASSISNYLGRFRVRGQPLRRSVMSLAAIAVPSALAFASAALVYGDASHEGWPTTVVYKSHPDDQNGRIRGTRRSDELLGGHGNDSIYGRGAADVIWGDFKPCCQPSRQHDRLHGGAGNDFIYASHGTNDITGGPGNDVVHAHYGRGGTIDCGSGNDLLFLSHRSKPHYGVRNCERTTSKHEGK